MKVKLKESAWKYPPAIDPKSYGLDYTSFYVVEWTKYSGSNKSYKILDKGVYDSSYFEEVEFKDDF